MNLSNVNVQIIYKALFSRFFEVTDLLYDNEFINEVDRKTAKIFSNKKPNDGRESNDVFNDVLLGELGEVGILELCKKSGLKTEHNIEETTREYYWDNKIETLKCEIKFQGEGLTEESVPRRYFGFNNKNKEGMAFSHWKSYDLIIPFYLKVIDNKIYVVPWFLIDSSVMNPLNLAKDGISYYRDSKFSGKIVSFAAESDGLMIRLNYNQNIFSI